MWCAGQQRHVGLFHGGKALCTKERLWSEGWRPRPHPGAATVRETQRCALPPLTPQRLPQLPGPGLASAWSPRGSAGAPRTLASGGGRSVTVSTLEAMLSPTWGRSWWIQHSVVWSKVPSKPLGPCALWESAVAWTQRRCQPSTWGWKGRKLVAACGCAGEQTKPSGQVGLS